MANAQTRTTNFQGKQGMRTGVWLSAVFAVLFCLIAPAQAAVVPETRTSAVLQALIEPLKAFSGYYISVDNGTLSLRGSAKDPAAYLKAVQSVPMFDGAQLTRQSAAPSDKPQVFALTANIKGIAAASSDDVARADVSAAELSSATGKIFKNGRCEPVSELAVTSGSMFRWRCPTDLQGVSGLVAELESALGGIEVSDFAVFESIVRQPSMDIRFLARPRR